MSMLSILMVCLVSVSLVVCVKEHAEHGHQHPADKDGQHDSSYDHEAILGSKEEAKQYGELPPEKAKEKLSLLYVKMDKDGDGKLTKDELKDWVFTSFIKMDMNDAQTRMSDYDTDKNNELTWPELLLGVYSYNEEDVENMRKEDSDGNKEMLDLVEEEKRKFKGADLDKSNSLNIEEFAAFEHPYNYPHMHQFEVDRMLKEHDKNDDGKVSFEEFKSKDADAENKEYEKEHFTSLDKDKDGYLNRDEVAHWVSPDNADSAREEGEHLISHADKNEDGSLSIDEVLNQHELFVGSQATDYGNFLHKHPDEL